MTDVSARCHNVLLLSFVRPAGQELNRRKVLVVIARNGSYSEIYCLSGPGNIPQHCSIEPLRVS